MLSGLRIDLEIRARPVHWIVVDVRPKSIISKAILHDFVLFILFPHRFEDLLLCIDWRCVPVEFIRASFGAEVSEEVEQQAAFLAGFDVMNVVAVSSERGPVSLAVSAL